MLGQDIHVPLAHAGQQARNSTAFATFTLFVTLNTISESFWLCAGFRQILKLLNETPASGWGGQWGKRGEGWVFLERLSLRHFR
ncbi:MAG: hypothetical protein SNJ60_02875, partial [Pseudanabaenaceae cyanobacterium]